MDATTSSHNLKYFRLKGLILIHKYKKKVLVRSQRFLIKKNEITKIHCKIKMKFLKF